MDFEIGIKSLNDVFVLFDQLNLRLSEGERLLIGSKPEND